MRFSILIAVLYLGLAAPAFSQSDCAATKLGQVGCGAGTQPYVTQMGDTLGSRGGAWYTSDPDPKDSVRGAYPYNSTLGEARDPTGRPYTRSLGVGCDPLTPGSCN